MPREKDKTMIPLVEQMAGIVREKCGISPRRRQRIRHNPSTNTHWSTDVNAHETPPHGGGFASIASMSQSPNWLRPHLRQRAGGAQIDRTHSAPRLEQGAGEGFRWDTADGAQRRAQIMERVVKMLSPGAKLN
jgi:hypothetical protein